MTLRNWDPQGRRRSRRPWHLRHPTHPISILSFSSVLFTSARLSFSFSRSHLICRIYLHVAPRPTSPALARVPAISTSIFIFSLSSSIVLYIHLNAECSLCLDDCHRCRCSHTPLSLAPALTLYTPCSDLQSPSVHPIPRPSTPLDRLPAGTRAPTCISVHAVLIAPSL